jgi:hypothetical protein
LSELAKELKPHFREEAIQNVEAEINKLTETVKWAEDYRKGLNPVILIWARQWRNKLGQ